MARTTHKESGLSLISALEALKAPGGGKSLDDLLANATMSHRSASEQIEGNLERLFAPDQAPGSVAAPVRTLKELASAGQGASRTMKALNSFSEIKRHGCSAAAVVALKVPDYEYGEHAVGRVCRSSGEAINLNLTFGRTPERAEARREAGRGDVFSLKQDAMGFVLISADSGKVYRRVQVFAREK